MTDITPTERDTLLHYIELARRKSTPDKWFPVGVKSDLYTTFDSLASNGLAEKQELGAMPANGAPTCLFRINDAGRAAV